MSRFFIATLAVSALFAGSVHAQSSTTPQLTDAQRQKLEQAGERFRAADRNGDGLISRAEADAGLPRVAKHFDQLDTDHDGQLAPDEFRAAMQRLRAQSR
jgi:Ca2+-binding EF-hand superfamily protein